MFYIFTRTLLSESLQPFVPAFGAAGQDSQRPSLPFPKAELIARFSRIRRLAIALVVGILLISPLSGRQAHATSFTVTDADFVGGVYDFHFYNSTTSRTVINGVDQSIADPTLTNTGWVCCDSDGGARYWEVPGAYNATQLVGDLTMGWDFSGVTGQIASIELKPANYLHQFDPYITVAVGDSISGSVRTPTTFGTGALTQLYKYTATASTTTQAANTLTDISSSLAASWLNNPELLELAFAYDLTAGPDIPGRHVQIFTDNGPTPGTGDSGFVLRVTLAQNVSAVPIPATLPLFLTGAGLLGLVSRRRKWRARRKKQAA